MNLLILILISMVSYAQKERDELCAANWETQVEKRIALPDDVNYFVRASGKGDLGFATSKGNRILNIDSERMSAFPGNYDPVPTPDGELVVLPQWSTYKPESGQLEPVIGLTPQKSLSRVNFMVTSNEVYKKRWKIATQEEDWDKVDITEEKLRSDKIPFDKSVMNFYSQQQNEKGDFPRVHSDERVNGTYQSFGKVRENGSESLYRMLIAHEDSGVATKDYSFNRSSGRIETTNTPPTPICQGTGNYSLPMINRQGTELSAYDSISQSTVIIRISDCRVVDQIPGVVGKSDFSPSGRKIAFHVDSLSDNPLFKTPDSKSDLGIFVYDRDTKQATPVLGRPNENNYYPVFIKENQIAFVSGSKEEKPKYAINVVNVKPSNFISCGECSPKTREGQFSAYIGLVYSEICNVGDKSFRSSIVNYNRLTPYKCKLLLDRLTDEAIEKSKRVLEKQKSTADDLWDISILGTLSRQKLMKLCKVATNAQEPSSSNVTK